MYSRSQSFSAIFADQGNALFRGIYCMQPTKTKGCMHKFVRLVESLRAGVSEPGASLEIQREESWSQGRSVSWSTHARNRYSELWCRPDRGGLRDQPHAQKWYPWYSGVAITHGFYSLLGFIRVTSTNSRLTIDGNIYLFKNQRSKHLTITCEVYSKVLASPNWLVCSALPKSKVPTIFV